MKNHQRPKAFLLQISESLRPGRLKTEIPCVGGSGLSKLKCTRRAFTYLSRLD